jgi:hypothetical protein
MHTDVRCPPTHEVGNHGKANESEAERDEALDALAAQAAEEEPAEEPEPEPMDEPAEIGDTVLVEWGSGETGSITISDVESTTKPYDQYGSGPKYDRFVVFSVDLEARADQFNVYEDDFYVVIDGTRYDHGEGNAYDAADYDDQLGYAELNAGGKKSGLLVFDLSEASGELFYAPNFEGGSHRFVEVLIFKNAESRPPWSGRAAT